MATRQTSNVLSEEFLMDAYFTCMNNDYILAVVMENVRKEYLPDKDFIKLHTTLLSYYKEYKKAPTYSILIQSLSDDRSVTTLVEDIFSTSSEIETEQILEQLENYISQVRFQKTYKEVGELYNKQGFDKASEKLAEYAKWKETFSLRASEFVDVVSTFRVRFKENRQKHNASAKKKPITRFYIDGLDEMNNGRDLRTQLTCFLAATGVGKSHIARWVGKSACYMDGANVLHIQLEGSKAEVTNAYSASLVGCSSYRYETGTIKDVEMDRYEEELLSVAGKLFVKSYPKFNCHVSTVDIKNAITDFRRQYGIDPDIVIIDSMDLLTDSSGRNWGEQERLKRVAVANDLKDIAADEDVWMVTTYQSTIEDRQWLNDEKNVLTEYNSAEAKGISRPMTHLITLNQSDRERGENTMRLFVAKSRFFKKGEPFRIATDYDHEQFYERVRTMNLNKVQ